ncbi:MAG: hypothetical protein WBE86_10260 [Candidatus Acidiferrales bacterium]
MKFRTASKLVILCTVGLAVAPFARAQSTSLPAQQSSVSTASTPATTAAPDAKSAPSAPAVQSGKYIQVPTGTRLPLVLHNAISTRGLAIPSIWRRFFRF